MSNDDFIIKKMVNVDPEALIDASKVRLGEYYEDAFDLRAALADPVQDWLTNNMSGRVAGSAFYSANLGTMMFERADDAGLFVARFPEAIY